MLSSPSVSTPHTTLLTRVFDAGDAGAFACDVPFSDATTQEENEALAAAGKVLLASDVAVGESIVCRGTYVLTSDDIDALETMSTVSVSATDKFGKEVTDEATATTSLEQVRSFKWQRWFKPISPIIIPRK